MLVYEKLRETDEGNRKSETPLCPASTYDI